MAITNGKSSFLEEKKKFLVWGNWHTTYWKEMLMHSQKWPNLLQNRKAIVSESKS